MTTLQSSATLPAPVDPPPAATGRPEEFPPGGGRVLWHRLIPFASFHVIAVVGVFLVGFSWAALALCVALYVTRMFVITGFYHRYFSHRTFKVSRAVQAIAAFLGTTTAQRGPIWWAAHHRHHHRHSDEPPDMHSPVQYDLEHSHMLWFATEQGMKTNAKAVPDLLKFPELRFIERFHLLGVAALAAFSWLAGWALARWAPGLGTGPWQTFVWGYGISTVLLYHGTFTINSLAHTWGRRRYDTPDDSRNNFWLALITLGEGWHNNHHYYPGTARQGFYWWEIDITYYVLWCMEKVGIVSDLRRAPAKVYQTR